VIHRLRLTRRAQIAKAIHHPPSRGGRESAAIIIIIGGASIANPSVHPHHDGGKTLVRVRRRKRYVPKPRWSINSQSHRPSRASTSNS
jgi:hypothetical protein